MLSDGFRLCDWEKDKMIELVKNVERDYIREESKETGRRLGRKEGMQQAISNTIKSMLNKNFSLEVISDITGKSIK